MCRDTKKYVLYFCLWAAMWGTMVVAITDSITVIIIGSIVMALGCLGAAEIIIGIERKE